MRCAPDARQAVDYGLMAFARRFSVVVARAFSRLRVRHFPQLKSSKGPQRADRRVLWRVTNGYGYRKMVQRDQGLWLYPAG